MSTQNTRPFRRVTGARAFGALHVRNYRLYFLSQLVSLSGTSMQAIGLAWLVLNRLDGSGLELGVVTAAQFLPLLVFGPYGGMIADRRDKRRLLLVTQSLSGAVALMLASLTASGDIRLWMVYALAFASGGIGAVDGPARQVFAMDMVGPDLVGNAVSLNEVVINASRVFGPAIGGVVVAQFSTAACFFVNAASFVPPIIAMTMIRASEMHPVAIAKPAPRQLREGIRYLLATPSLRALVLMAAASAMIFNFGVALPVLAKNVLHSGADGYGAMVAAFGVGALGGAFFAASDPRPRGRRVRLLAVVSGAVVLACAVMPNMAFELVAMFVSGATSIWFISLANALLQLRTEPAMRGRVMGLWTMALPGSLPITGPLVGWITIGLGARAALGTAGVAVLATAAAGWWALGDSPSPLARRRGHRGIGRALTPDGVEPVDASAT